MHPARTWFDGNITDGCTGELFPDCIEKLLESFGNPICRYRIGRGQVIITAINNNLFGMVRNDNVGVDLGIWKNISPAYLSCPLDVHSGNVARKLGLLNRKQNESKIFRGTLIFTKFFSIYLTFKFYERYFLVLL